MSSEAISTLRLSRWIMRRASLAVVVVLPEPCRPTIMIGDRRHRIEVDGLAVGAERGDQFVMDDLDHHLAGRDRLDDGGADRLLADAIGEASDDVERDVGFQQRAAHLAHRGVDIGFRQRTAARQPIEYRHQAFPTDCRTMPLSCLLPVASDTAARSKHFRARGRIALSGVGLRPQGPGGGSKRTSFRESARVKPPESGKVKESLAQGILRRSSCCKSFERFRANCVSILTAVCGGELLVAAGSKLASHAI